MGRVEFTFIDTDDHVTHVVVRGRLDQANATRLESELGHINARRQPVLMELRDVEFIASIAIGLLAVCAQGLARCDCRMVLVAPSSLVERALRSTRADQLIPIAADLEHARALLASG
jgi:anti-anti-sigma factor